MINCIFKNFDNYEDMNGATFDNVTVSVTNGSGSDAGSVTLSGMVTGLVVSGRDHCVDNLSYSRFLD